MGFWQNVQNEIDFKNITRKELAQKAGFSVNTISSGIKRNGMPEADLALRISRILDVPLEILLDDQNYEKNIAATEAERKKDRLFDGYLKVVETLDSLSPESRDSVLTIIKNLKR